MLKKVTIVGFGNVGSQIGALLMNQTNHTFLINIMEVSVEMSGTFLDFGQANEAQQKHEFVLNDPAVFNASDLIIHCAGANVPKGKDRAYISNATAEITDKVFHSYVCNNPNVKIIVVANPVESITYVTQKITGIPYHQVTSTGTLLDSMRLNSFLREFDSDLKYAQLNSVILGEHGKSAYISNVLSRIDHEPLDSLVLPESQDLLLNKVKDAAAQIKSTEGATIYGIAFCTVKLILALLENSTSVLPITGYLTDKISEYINLPKIYMSVPCEVSNKGAFVADENLEWLENSEENFKKAHKTIYDAIPERYL